MAHMPDIAPGARSEATTGKVAPMHKYEIIIYWSNDDGVFIAEAPELPGCAAHGDTQEVGS